MTSNVLEVIVIVQIIVHSKIAQDFIGTPTEIDAKTPHFIIQCNLKFNGSVQIGYSVGKRGTLRNQCVLF